jgi:hypothetical protein
MADPATILGLSYVGGKGIELVSEFVKEIFKPSATVIGEELAQPLKAWQERRPERATRLIIDAAVAVEESGETPQSVPGRILGPLLEKGSLEDDDDLRARWVRLLANAATPSMAADVHPAFVHILSELNPLEARWLAAMYGPGGIAYASYKEVNDRRAAGTLPGVSLEEVNYANLERLNILEKQQELEIKLADLQRELTQHSKLPSPQYSPRAIQVKPAMRSRHDLTSLGRSFVKACVSTPSTKDSGLSPD